MNYSKVSGRISTLAASFLLSAANTGAPQARPAYSSAQVRAIRWDGGPLECKRRQVMGTIPQNSSKLADAIRNWYSPSTVEYLVQADFNSAWLTWSVGLGKEEEAKEAVRVRDYIKVCRQRGIRAMGILSADQFIALPETACISRKTAKDSQGQPVPCRGTKVPSPPSPACFQANLEEPEWQKAIAERSIEAIASGAEGVILDGLSSGSYKLASVAGFVGEVTRIIKSAYPAALVVPLASSEQQEVLAQSPVVALDDGLWPGIRAASINLGGEKMMVAGASQGTWVDQNIWLLTLSASFANNRPVVLVHQPSFTEREGEVKYYPAGSRALSLVEAAVFGGSCVLGLDDWLRLGLSERDPQALQEWNQMSRYQAFLEQHKQYLELPFLSNAAVVVENLAETAEELNLLARRGVQYRVFRRTDLSRAVLKPEDLVVDVNPGPLSPVALRRLVEFVQSGGSVMTDLSNLPNLLKKSEPSSADQSDNCDEYRLDRGKWIGCQNPLSDPDQLARDVQRRLPFSERWLRFWNAPMVFARTALMLNSGGRIVHLVNFGIEPIEELQVQVKGSFSRVRVLTPDHSDGLAAKDAPLVSASHGGFTEFVLPNLGIYSLVLLE